MADDAMVPIARLLGRGEALTVAAMLDAAGIIVHVGGEYYTSVSPDILAIGGFRLAVPAWQHEEASALLADMLAEPEPQPNDHMRRALGRFALATMAMMGVAVLPYAAVLGLKSLAVVLLSPVSMIVLPVNPQGRGDYYLVAARSD
ncbi:hypothetical protein [Sphingopyxis sp.]|jgi:hypothetical protein|uniref:hypothetical protein n=1 Tax=Sphingopyxis sp. TaxID=1908224 RepID=UPI002DE75077|nr:hypothetical protein [Sphingopyxis sp.]